MSPRNESIPQSVPRFTVGLTCSRIPYLVIDERDLSTTKLIKTANLAHQDFCKCYFLGVEPGDKARPYY